MPAMHTQVFRHQMLSVWKAGEQIMTCLVFQIGSAPAFGAGNDQKNRENARQGNQANGCINQANLSQYTKQLPSGRLRQHPKTVAAVITGPYVLVPESGIRLLRACPAAGANFV